MSEQRFKVLDMVAEVQRVLDNWPEKDRPLIMLHHGYEEQLRNLLPLAEVAEAVAALQRDSNEVGRWQVATEKQIVALKQRLTALQADNARLRADLDAANRRWDGWAQIVQPEMLKTSQLDTERRLAEVERRVEGQG